MIIINWYSDHSVTKNYTSLWRTRETLNLHHKVKGLLLTNVLIFEFVSRLKICDAKKALIVSTNFSESAIFKLSTRTYFHQSQILRKEILIECRIIVRNDKLR